MALRRSLRRLTPRPLRQLVYDRSRTGRQAWKSAPGIERIPAGTGAVLTFDDGPDSKYTPSLLDALDRAEARATFFVVGERVPTAEGILREIEARGHEVALHGLTHRRHDSLDQDQARAELSDGLAAIATAGVRRPRWYRPPFGGTSPTLAQVCDELGLGLAYWSAWGQDWESLPATRIVALVARDLGPGAVVLLHDSPLYAERESAAPTIEAVAGIAAVAARDGIKLVTLSEAVATADSSRG